MTIKGECFCGQITYEISGPLSDPRSCHCSRCRKAFSSQASAYALVKSEDFTWTSGERELTSYVNKGGFGIQFCRKCGSTLCGIYKDVIHGVTLGCVNGSPELTPIKHIYVGSKANWEVIPDGVSQYDEAPTD